MSSHHSVGSVMGFLGLEAREFLSMVEVTMEMCGHHRQLPSSPISKVSRRQWVARGPFQSLHWMDDASGTTLCFPSGSRNRPDHSTQSGTGAKKAESSGTTQIEELLSYRVRRLSIKELTTQKIRHDKRQRLLSSFAIRQCLGSTYNLTV